MEKKKKTMISTYAFSYFGQLCDFSNLPHQNMRLINIGSTYGCWEEERCLYMYKD